jgi:outer membrane immunogenic protein
VVKTLKQEKHMSFRSALITSAAILTAGSAIAADLPGRVVAQAPYHAAPIFTWTGFYAGLNAGAGFNNESNGYTTSQGYNGTTFTTTGGGFGNGNDVGFTGGAQAGYNMQFGMFVAGVEADINYLDRGKGGSTTVFGGDTTYTFNRGGSNNWFGTARGRLGIAFDRFLPYVTAGWAFGGKQGGVSGSYVTSGSPTLMIGNGNGGNSSGWTLGGGVEYAFSNTMSLKVEYLHVKLGDNNNQLAFNTDPNKFFSFKNENKFDVVRAGINYRF